MIQLEKQLDTILPTQIVGSVARTVGLALSVADFPAPLGSLAEVQRQSGGWIEAEVIGFRDDQTLVYPLEAVAGIRRGSRVRLRRTVRTFKLGEQMLGRVVNSRGQAIDGRPHPLLKDQSRFERSAPSPVDRPRIDEMLTTGIRAIDGLLTCGKGQRVGIFSGSGVGKSVLLSMIARYTTADINVIALIGERGREVNEFIERDLGPEGLARSIVVVATSDEPAIVRLQAAFCATSIAEYFRDRGRDVMLIMDSATRLAMAQREIGLAMGEPPTTRGYPPSVFSLLPALLERTGRTPEGSITAFYSVLVEGDDPNEPIADTLRGVLDGHFWLSRKIASRGQYPAIDILESISRLMTEVSNVEHQGAARHFRELLGAYRDHEDLISIGAYRHGANPTVDAAIAAREEMVKYLQQDVGEKTTLEDTRKWLIELSARTQVAVSNNPVPSSSD